MSSSFGKTISCSPVIFGQISLLEIRNLEGEMQTLVYDNYNKFISATDTVKSVKKKIDAMEEELGKLKTSVSKIGGSYDKVNIRLEQKWKEIRRLDAIERDLDELQFLRELPSILKNALLTYETGKHASDVFKVPLKHYLQSAELLEQYKSTVFFAYLIHINRHSSAHCIQK